MKIRTYSELKNLKTFAERYEYLELGGQVGADTFGFDRYLNQTFYQSPEWKKVRNEVILRDMGCDLGIEDRQLYERIIIHHMNPITAQQIMDRDPSIFDPMYLICCGHATHNAIHFGIENPDPIIVTRTPGDTCPWK